MANTNIKPRGAIASNLPPVAPDAALHGLQFPKNDGTSQATAMTAIQFLSPEDNGLPIWGPSNAGVTVVRKIYVDTQNASANSHYYYAQFWWSTADANFEWNGGLPDTYWGMHPYPPVNTVADWDWELATANGGDFHLNVTGNPYNFVPNAWYTQGVRVTRNGDATKTIRFYPELPSVDDDHVIQRINAAGYGESYPTNTALTIGDSPWWSQVSLQHETFCGIQGPIKIFDKVLSEADMLSEAADFTQLATAEGIAHIWWGKKTFATVDDLTCDYGTGRSFFWFDSSKKATLVDI